MFFLCLLTYSVDSLYVFKFSQGQEILPGSSPWLILLVEEGQNFFRSELSICHSEEFHKDEDIVIFLLLTNNIYSRLATYTSLIFVNNDVMHKFAYFRDASGQCGIYMRSYFNNCWWQQSRTWIFFRYGLYLV